MINQGILSSLKHSSITNLKSRKINNHDAALLIIASSDGIAKSPEVIKQLQVWRGQPLTFVYLWNTSQSGGYGFVGRDVNSVSNEVYHCPTGRSGSDCTTQRRTYWYRVKKGQYRLTLEGFRRLAELQDQLSR
jgi:hypothetical protein